MAGESRHLVVNVVDQIVNFGGRSLGNSPRESFVEIPAEHAMATAESCFFVRRLGGLSAGRVTEEHPIFRRNHAIDRHVPRVAGVDPRYKYLSRAPASSDVRSPLISRIGSPVATGACGLVSLAMT